MFFIFRKLRLRQKLAEYLLNKLSTIITVITTFIVRVYFPINKYIESTKCLQLFELVRKKSQLKNYIFGCVVTLRCTLNIISINTIVCVSNFVSYFLNKLIKTFIIEYFSIYKSPILFNFRFSLRICNSVVLVCETPNYMKNPNWKWNVTRCYWTWHEWFSRNKAPSSTWYTEYSRTCKA